MSGQVPPSDRGPDGRFCVRPVRRGVGVLTVEPVDFATLAEHLAAIDQAYRRLRALVIDPLPGVALDDPSLDLAQRRAVVDFRRAEEALDRYRRQCYEA